MPRLRSILIGMLTTSPAFAQSFNIDFDNPNGGWGLGVPASSFGGAAGQPGVWNAVTEMGHSYPLWSRNGFPTGVTLETVGVASGYSYNHPQAGGDYGQLMEDGFSVPTDDVSLFFNIQNLSAGRYFIYVYGALTDYGDEPETFVSLLPFIGDQEVGGFPYEDNTFYEGTTHLRYQVDLADGAWTSIRISTRPVHDGAHGTVVGIQIQKLPPRIYVRADAPAGGDGFTWATAFNNLQDAITQAREWDGAVDEIWVAHGSYYPTDGPTQSIAFDMPSGVADVYGGFAGNETSREQRDPLANPTILSGNIGGPLPDDNSDSVVEISPTLGTDGAFVLDGFTIMGGSGGYFSGEFGLGAGMQVHGGDVTVRNCRFLSNEAENGAATYAWAGTVTFVDCEFLNNSAASGGGAYANTVVEPNPGPVARFINCRFHDNHASARGGAINVSGGATTLVNCVFTGNSSFWDGGAIRASGTGTIVTTLNCTIAGNISSSLGGSPGGGLSVASGASATMVNTIFWDNDAASAYNGTMQSQLAWASGGTVAANYSTVQFYFSLLLPGTANNGTNPQFVDATGGDGYGGVNDNVRLSAGSPLVDSGSNFGISQDWGDLDGDGDMDEQTPLDLDGFMRRVDDPSAPNSGNGFGPLVDRGAFEFQAPCDLAGDLDGDGDVDLSDLATLLGSFGTTGGADPSDGDTDSDGDVDLSDLTVLLSAFGTACP